MIVRQATCADHQPTEELTRSAFWNVYCPGCYEHFLLHQMRKHADYRPELDIVAEQEGEIVGHCICYPSHIEGDDMNRHQVLTLGPIAVEPAHQHLGIGTALISKAKEIAADMSYDGLLLCGDPDYYLRRGFAPAKQWGIRNADNKFFKPLMATELRDGALAACAGRYMEHEIYFSLTEEEVEAFDQRFPRQAKQSDTPSQQRFATLLSTAEE